MSYLVAIKVHVQSLNFDLDVIHNVLNRVVVNLDLKHHQIVNLHLLVDLGLFLLLLLFVNLGLRSWYRLISHHFPHVFPCKMTAFNDFLWFCNDFGMPLFVLGKLGV